MVPKGSRMIFRYLPSKRLIWKLNMAPCKRRFHSLENHIHPFSSIRQVPRQHSYLWGVSKNLSSNFHKSFYYFVHLFSFGGNASNTPPNGFACQPEALGQEFCICKVFQVKGVRLAKKNGSDVFGLGATRLKKNNGRRLSSKKLVDY